MLGAAAEVEDVLAAINDGHGLIAADGAVGVLTETNVPAVAWDASSAACLFACLAVSLIRACSLTAMT